MHRYRWALGSAICVAAVSLLALAIPADAQWRDRDGARRRPPVGYGGYYNVAYSQGYDDGYERGLDDARDRDRYDVRRHGRYRSGDHGYNRRYGDRDEYKRDYRAGFADGYGPGYREGERYERGWPGRRDWPRGRW